MNRFILLIGLVSCLFGCGSVADVEHVDSSESALTNSACPDNFSTLWTRSTYNGSPTCSATWTAREDTVLHAPLLRNYTPAPGTPLGFADLEEYSDGFFENHLTTIMGFQLNRINNPPSVYSGASILDASTQDSVPLENVTCPALEPMIDSSGYVTYPYVTAGAGDSSPWIAQGRTYCVLADLHRVVLKVRVTQWSNTGSASDPIALRLMVAGSTGKIFVRAYGDNVTTILVGATKPAVYTNDPQRDLLNADYAIRDRVKLCVDGYLGLTPGVRRIVRVHFAEDHPCESTACYHHGLASQSWGFEGSRTMGQTAVTSVANIRVSAHEMIHQYNNIYIGWIKSWMDEGFAIALARRQCDPAQFIDQWRGSYARVKSGLDPRPNNGHAMGSAFFEGLSVEIPTCVHACHAGIWARVAARTNKTTTLTLAELRAAARAQVGTANAARVDTVISVLGITEATNI